MKKYFPVFLILATLTLSACGAKTSENNTTTTQDQTSKTTQNTESRSLKDLLGLGTSQRCTYEVNDNGEVMKGEIIVDGKKFKQTTEITNKEGSMKVYSISDGTYYYSWSDLMKGNGTKMKIEEAETNQTPTNTDKTEQQGISFDKKIDYICTPTTLSESDLALPTDVKFVDYTEMMKGLQNGNLEDLKNLVPSEGE